MRVSYVSALLGLLTMATEGKLSFATVDVSVSWRTRWRYLYLQGQYVNICNVLSDGH